MTVVAVNTKANPAYVDVGSGTAIPFTGVTNKYGAALKGLATAGNLSSVVGWQKVYDIRDFGAVDDDATDCAPAYVAAVTAAIAAAGTGLVVIYTPPTASYWRIKSSITFDDGSHTQFGECRQIFFVGEGDAGPLRIDTPATYVFDLDVGEGQIPRRDQRLGFYNMTLVTSNDPAFGKGVDCVALFGILAADVSRYDFVGIHIVGVWSSTQHFVFIDGSPRLDWVIVEGGFCGAGGGNAICRMSAWAVADGTDLYAFNTGRFRGVTWAGGGVQFGSWVEVFSPQDFDSTLQLRRFTIETGCLRMVWCTQANSNRLRVLHASNFVTLLGLSAGIPCFDLKQVVSTVIEEGEVELAGSSTIMLNATSCDNITVRHCRSDFGATSVYVAADNTCNSVIVDECELATDSPNPAGVRSDAAVTIVIKNGVEGTLFKASGTVTKNDWARISGAGTVDSGGITHVAEVIGILQVNGVLNDYVPVAIKQGQLVNMISDGTTVIAAGDPLAPAAAGQVLKDAVPASHTIMGRAITGATNVAGTVFKALFFLTWGA